MRIWTVEYINYEGQFKWTEVETEDDAEEMDAQLKAILEDDGWGDGIHKIISCA